LQVRNKTDSKLLNRSYVEVLFTDKSGKLSRKEAVTLVAETMKVDADRVGLIRLEERSGTTDVLGRFEVYGSAEVKKQLHPRHLQVRLLTKEEREKLKQAKKAAAAPAPAAEAKK
jgi:ribosomal protein S24E